MHFRCLTWASCSLVESLCFDALLFRFGFLYTRAGWHDYDCSGRGDILLNHKHYFVSQRMWQNSDQYFKTTNTFQRHPTHTAIPSGLSFLERESGDRRVRGDAETGRGFSAPQINFVQENIIMELATFKRSALTQIICYKTVFMCVHVWLFAWFLGVCLFVFRLFVKPYLLQFSMYLCW